MPNNRVVTFAVLVLVLVATPARSDRFDKVDQEQLKLNAAIAATFVWGYANAEIGWGRLERAGVQKVIDGGLGDHMRAFRVMKEGGSRGRPE